MTTEAVATKAPPAEGWVPNTESFGARLALVRWKMGWNVAEAAQECGLLRQNWRLWEEGREPRRLVTIAMAIAGRTGVDIDWLIRGRQPNASYPTLEELINPPPHPAMQQRVLQRREVLHGDGRRKLPVGQKSRTSRQRGDVRRRTRSVSLPAVA